MCGGLVSFGYRFYAPHLGRWTSRDPLGEAGGLNLYAYVANNPVNWVDPWGLRVCTAEKQRFFTWLYKDINTMATDLNTQTIFLLSLAAKEGGWTTEALDHNMPLNDPFGVNTIRNGRAAGNKSYTSLEEAIQEWIQIFGNRVKNSQTLQDFIDGLQCKGKTCSKYNSATSNYETMFKKVHKSVEGYETACQDVIKKLMEEPTCE